MTSPPSDKRHKPDAPNGVSGPSGSPVVALGPDRSPFSPRGSSVPVREAVTVIADDSPLENATVVSSD